MGMERDSSESEQTPEYTNKAKQQCAAFSSICKSQQSILSRNRQIKPTTSIIICDLILVIRTKLIYLNSIFFCFFYQCYPSGLINLLLLALTFKFYFYLYHLFFNFKTSETDLLNAYFCEFDKCIHTHNPTSQARYIFPSRPKVFHVTF